MKFPLSSPRHTWRFPLQRGVLREPRPFPQMQQPPRAWRCWGGRGLLLGAGCCAEQMGRDAAPLERAEQPGQCCAVLRLAGTRDKRSPLPCSPCAPGAPSSFSTGFFFLLLPPQRSSIHVCRAVPGWISSSFFPTVFLFLQQTNSQGSGWRHVGANLAWTLRPPHRAASLPDGAMGWHGHSFPATQLPWHLGGRQPCQRGAQPATPARPTRVALACSLWLRKAIVLSVRRCPVSFC